MRRLTIRQRIARELRKNKYLDLMLIPVIAF